MSQRKNIIVVCGIIYSLLAATIYFGLKFYSKRNFSTEKLNGMIVDQSKFSQYTTNLCGRQILGEPKVGKEYVKFSFLCKDGSKSNSTLALIAFDDKTIEGVIKEYARIIGFDVNILNEKGWYCLVNNAKLDENLNSEVIKPASSIDCFESINLARHD